MTVFRDITFLAAGPQVNAVVRCKGARKERPIRVFISSTVYDFRDLRSALKLWLEEYGYEVLLSEFNDFPQLPDHNSYDSCIRVIDRCDYFVQLIGHRTGGWVDRENRISITRAEYQYAYERARRRELNLITFARRELWDIREDRAALATAIRQAEFLDRELSEEDRTKIANHSSKFTNDAEFVFDFLREVGRVAEMKSAIAGETEFPSANWIYQFSTFRDIVDALRTVLDLSGNLRQKTVRTNLMHEIEVMLSHLLLRHDDDVFPITHYSTNARRRVSGGFGDSSIYTGTQLIRLAMLIFFYGNVGKRIKTDALQEAIQSGEFLEFDRSSGRHTVGSLQNALFELNTQIERLAVAYLPEVGILGHEILWNSQYKNNRNQEFTLPNDRLVMAFAIHDLMENVINLARAIYRSLQQNSNTTDDVNIHPTSPFQREAENLARERVTIDQVRSWLES